MLINTFVVSNNSVQLVTGGYVKLEYQEAYPFLRVMAYGIDMVVLMLLLVVYDIIVSSSGYIPASFYFLLSFIYSSFNVALELLCGGQTIGKMLLRIKVINSDCEQPTFLQVFYRWVMFPIDFFVGLFFIAKTNQRLGDMLSGCHVVHCRSKVQDAVKISKEFAYLSPDYKVKYPEAEKLTEAQVVAIQKVLHQSNYKSYNKTIEKKVKEILKLEYIDEGGRSFMQTLLNDYKYIEMNNNN